MCINQYNHILHLVNHYYILQLHLLLRHTTVTVTHYSLNENGDELEFIRFD